MLPTSARVVQEVYEPLIGIQYPMLCGLKNGQWHIGAGSIRKHEARATGLRFVQWMHRDNREAARADPPPEATGAVYRQIEHWLPVEDEERDNILVLTTRKDSAQSLRCFCQQSRRRTNVKTAVKVAGATARHCIVLHGQSSFLSGHSNQSNFDQECYTRANVAYSRATDLTVLACPVKKHGLTGASQVIGALLHGVCTIHTSYKTSSEARVEGSFEVGKKSVQASTTAFLDAMEPHPMWDGPIPVCLVEYYNHESRRLRLVLTSQGLLSKGEKLLMSSNHPVHRSGLLFGYAADGCSDPDWLVVPDGSHPHSWRLLHAVSKGGGTRFTVGSTVRYPPGQAADAAYKAKDYQFEALRKIYFYDAWRCQPELNKANSFIHLPPAPGLLQNGCYWRPAEAVSDSASNSGPQQSSVTVHESSSAEDEAAVHDGNAQPSLLPSPSSTDCDKDHPVSVSSEEEEAASSPTQASEPSTEKTV